MFWNVGTIEYEKSSEFPDLAFLEKDEFKLFNDKEKIEFLLKQWGIGSEIKNLYYGYIKKNFKEKWDSIIDAAKELAYYNKIRKEMADMKKQPIKKGISLNWNTPEGIE